jgi:flagellar hook-basal body complex protein FliE
MSTVNLSALNAYRNQLKMQEGMEDAAAGLQQDSGPSFSSMVADALKTAANEQYSTETVKMDAMTGKVELADLVSAVSNAELTLNTVVAVRDRVISAYQDIIRMPI